MSTLPSLSLKSNILSDKIFEKEVETVSQGATNKSTDIACEDIFIEENDKRQPIQRKIATQRTVSKFYEYESTESNTRNQSETNLKNNINPILTLFESLDLEQCSRRNRLRRRNLTYSNSNMKQYNKIIIENQELFQIVTKLDFVVKRVNTNELLEILADIQNKINLIERYDKDIQSLREQNIQKRKKINGDQISLISEYFTLMHGTLGKKYDTIAKLITENIAEIDLELKQDEKNNAMEKNDIQTEIKCETVQSKSQEKIDLFDQTITQKIIDPDIMRAKKAREKFQLRGNSKKRYDLQKNDSSDNKKKIEYWKESQTSCSFTDINVSPFDSSVTSDHEISDFESKGISVLRMKQVSQSTEETKSLEFQLGEKLLESQNNLEVYDLHSSANVQEVTLSETEYHGGYHNIRDNRLNGQNHLMSKEIESLNELINQEKQSELKRLKSHNDEEMLNDIPLRNHEIQNKKTLCGEKENAEDDNCVQSKKFSVEEKVKERQTNLHIKETNFHCSAYLNKNNLKMYDNEDRSKTKEDYFSFYALNSQDDIECNNNLNNLEIRNVSDLIQLKQTEEGKEYGTVVGEMKRERGEIEFECEVNYTIQDKESLLCDDEDDQYKNLQCTEVNTSDVKAPLQDNSNSKQNHDKDVCIKVSKNDLYTGKILTLNYEKENIGSAIQMKIELCKCSCLGTNNSTSTQTEVVLENAVKQESNKSTNNEFSRSNQILKGFSTKDEDDKANSTEKQNTSLDGESSKTILLKTNNSIGNCIEKNEQDDNNKPLDEVCEIEDKEKLQRTISPKHTREATEVKKAQISHTECYNENVGPQNLKLKKFYDYQVKQSDYDKTKLNINDPEIPRGLVNQLIVKYDTPQPNSSSKIIGNVKKENTILSK